MDPAWYFDTGAKDHVTPNFSKLTLAEDYTGEDKLQIGNGLNDTQMAPSNDTRQDLLLKVIAKKLG
ncbi:hypothetical protein LINPERPRIM_LOCUS15019 [Linum perenne]